MIGEELFSLPNIGSRGCLISDGVVYISSINFSDGIDTSTVNYTIHAYDLNDGHIIWEREISDGILAAGHSGVSCRSQQFDSGLVGELNPLYYAVIFIHTATPPSLTILPSIER